MQHCVHFDHLRRPLCGTVYDRLGSVALGAKRPEGAHCLEAEVFLEMPDDPTICPSHGFSTGGACPVVAPWRAARLVGRALLRKTR